jgi:lipopolysaccharide assembly protein A
MKHLKFLLAIALMLLVIIVLVQNHVTMSTQVSFRLDLLSLHLKTSSLSLYYVVTIAFVLGILVSAVYGILERFHLKKKIRMVTKELSDKEQELNSLRNLPITSDNMGSTETGSV